MIFQSYFPSLVQLRSASDRAAWWAPSTHSRRIHSSPEYFCFMVYLNVSDRSVIIFTLSTYLCSDNNYFCFIDVIFTCVLYHCCYDYSFNHTALYVYALMSIYVCLGIYRYIIESNFLLGQIFLCCSYLSCLMRQLLAADMLTVKVIALQKQQPVAVHCYIEKWMLWFGASFYWAATLRDGRYMWEKNIPNHQMFW